MSRAGGAEAALSARVLDGIRQVGGDKLVAEMLQIFAHHTPGRLEAARAALAADDLEAAAKALHSLRSAAGAVGANRVAESAGALERAARQDGADELASGFPLLEERVELALAAARAGSTPG